MHRGASAAIRALQLTLLAACCLGATAPHPSSQRLLEGLPPELVDRLFEKKWILLQQVDDDVASLSGGYLMAYVIFDQPFERTYELLTETSRQAEYRSDLSSVETIDRFPDGNLDEHQIKILLMKIKYRLRYRTDPKRHRISWSLDPDFDNDIDRIDGFWEVHPLDDGRTLARLGTIVDIGSMLPSMLQNMITSRNLPKTIERCRIWINANGGDKR